ncbi:hypothetical protein FSP39_010388 [Pinctada imbricata]|uniref:MD-2-related lipid-recognition domain-containing protein n=1 Tax=Pinctada imbricata TaxID=66713 RepID=A0AA88XYX7_PINIB|nr:hypothetical protein FSP39_010388 [Pinctada imbricata]
MGSGTKHTKRKPVTVTKFRKFHYIPVLLALLCALLQDQVSDKFIESTGQLTETYQVQIMDCFKVLLSRDPALPLEENFADVLTRPAPIDQKIANLNRKARELECMSQELETVIQENHKLKDDLSRVKRRLEEQSQLRAANLQLTRTKENLERRLTQYKHLEERCRDLHTKNKSMIPMLARRRVELLDLQSTLDARQRELDNSRQEITDLRYSISLHAEIKKEMRKEKEEMKALIEELQGTAAQEAGENMGAALEVKVRSLEEELQFVKSSWIPPSIHDDVKSRLEESAVIQDSLEKKYLEVKGQLNNLNTELRSRSSLISQLEDEKRSLEKDLQEKDAEIVQLEVKIKEITGLCEQKEKELQRQDSDHRSKMDGLWRRLEGRINQIIQLKGEVSLANKKVESLEAKLQSNTEKGDEVQSEAKKGIEVKSKAEKGNEVEKKSDEALQDVKNLRTQDLPDENSPSITKEKVDTKCEVQKNKHHETEEMEKVKNSCNELSMEVEIKQKELDGIKYERDELAEKVSRLEKNLDAKVSECEKLMSKIDQSSSESEILKGEIEGKITQLELLQEELESSRLKWDQEKLDMNTRLETLSVQAASRYETETEKEELLQRISKLEKEAEEASQKLWEKTNEVESMVRSDSELTEKLFVMTDKISLVEEQICELTEEKSCLKSENSSLISEVSDLQILNTELQRKNKDLEDCNAKMNEERKEGLDLQTKVNDLTCKLSDSENQIQMQRSDWMSKLKAANETMETAIFEKEYMTVFNHEPPSEIIEANRLALQAERKVGRQKAHRNNDGEDEETDKTAKVWQDFIDANNYVAIGDVFDTCEKGHQTIGKVILLNNEETGGLMARTFVNITLKTELTIGEFAVDVKYNGKELYDNKWEFCSMDENQKKRQIFCPYKAGKFYTWATDKNIPTYIPKGRYETKAWLTGDEGELITCGYSVLVL